MRTPLTQQRVDLRKVSGVYAVIHRASGRAYVGSTCDANRRRQQILLVQGSPKLAAAFAEFGLAAFDFEFLEACSGARLMAQEQAWITKMDAIANGYNHIPSIVHPRHPLAIERLEKGIKAKQMRLHLGLSAETMRLIDRMEQPMPAAVEVAYRNALDIMAARGRMETYHRPLSPECARIIKALPQAEQRAIIEAAADMIS